MKYKTSIYIHVLNGELNAFEIRKTNTWWIVENLFSGRGLDSVQVRFIEKG